MTEMPSHLETCSEYQAKLSRSARGGLCDFAVSRCWCVGSAQAWISDRSADDWSSWVSGSHRVPPSVGDAGRSLMIAADGSSAECEERDCRIWPDGLARGFRPHGGTDVF